MKIIDVLKTEEAGVYKLAFRAELEGEEDTQYPLEDLLDKYYVICSSLEQSEEDGKRTMKFVIDADNEATAEKIEALAGKRVYNVEEDGYIKLVIE